MAIFNGYVNLPEGKLGKLPNQSFHQQTSRYDPACLQQTMVSIVGKSLPQDTTSYMTYPLLMTNIAIEHGHL